MKIRSTIHSAIFAGIFLALILSPLLSQPSLAQTPVQAQAITFQSALVNIWPEYDQPSVLVIYNVTLASNVTLPATLNLRIPAAAGKPNAVAMEDSAGLYNLNYTVSAAGDWVEVKVTTPVPQIRVEYYDPTLKKSGNQRDFTFHWPSNYTVENLTIKIQQPPTATNMAFRPDIGPGRSDTDGLTYYTLVAGKVDAGTPLELSFSYTKPDNTLTNAQQFQAAQPSQPINANTPGRVNLFQSWSPFQLGMLIAGFLLIAGGLFWYWRTGGSINVGRAEAAPRRARHGRASSSQPARQTQSPGTAASESSGSHAANRERLSTPVAQSDGVFCHQCGKKAAASDVFCRACGTRLR